MQPTDLATLHFMVQDEIEDKVKDVRGDVQFADRRIVALEERVAALELLVAELAHAANRQAESLRYLQRQLNGEGLP